MAGRSQGGANHRALKKHEVTGRRVALNGEILLEVTYLEFQVGDAGVADDGVLELYQSVGKVHVELTVPVLVNLCLDGETGAADADSATDGIGIGGGPEEGAGIKLDAVVEPDLVIRFGGFYYQEAVLGFGVEYIRLDGDAVLVVLDVLRMCRSEAKQQRSESE